MSLVKMQILATPLMLVSLVVVMVTYSGLTRAFGLPAPFSFTRSSWVRLLAVLGSMDRCLRAAGNQRLSAARVRSTENGQCAGKNFESDPPNHQAKGLAL